MTENNAETTVSILNKTKAEYEKAGSKPPAPDAAKKLLDGWKKSVQHRLSVEEQIDSAKELEYAACAKLALAYGCKSLRVEGVVYDFASRGERIFLRRKGSDVVDIG